MIESLCTTTLKEYLSTRTKVPEETKIEVASESTEYQ